MTVIAGRYRLLTRIGQGGMGVVWRAHDELLRRDIAVKELHVRIGVDGDFRARQVLQEARAAAQLRHPGVVAVHDVVVDDGRPLILMELVEGRSLAQVLRQQGPLSEERVAEIGARVLEALSMAHARGVLHRDVKPANILLDGERVVLTDFGIAAVTSDTTVTDGMVGSPEYLAPERVNGKPATPASDLWSLGVTLCTALRGESPFQRADTQATLAAVLTHEPPPVPEAPRLQRVLTMLLNRDPRQRPTATAAGAMLATIASIPRSPSKQSTELAVRPSTTPVVERDSGRVVEPLTESPTGPRLSARRLRMRLAALVTVLVLVAAGAVWLVVRSDGEVAGVAHGVKQTTLPLPSGFIANHGDGYSIAVPRAWFKDPSQQEVYWVSDPDSPNNVLAHLLWRNDVPRGGAFRALITYERNHFIDAKAVSNYHRVKLTKLPAPQGTTSAELEVTGHINQDGGFDIHERTRVIASGKRTYYLTIGAEGDDRAVTARLWRTGQKQLIAILESFRVTP